MSCDAPRYLVPFHPKRLPHYFTDVLIIGGGIAGLRAAMQIDPRLSLLVITKDRMEQSNSAFAQGGIASVLDPDDNFASHAEDTIGAGANLCDREIVEMVVSEAPEHIRQLIAWGTKFDTEKGELALGREGGHSHRRIVHALGDATGHEVMRAMIEQARSKVDADIWSNTFTIDLLTHEGRCRGAVVWHAQHGRTMVWAKQTILCTGGAGQIYRETTYRAGAELRDMEFMQFHPTVLYIAGGSRSLITEAMRGEGARLIDSSGKRFMPEYDERAELAPRDVVSRSIVAQMEKTRQPSVFLDLSHLDADRVRKRFPGIARTCLEFGIDIATDPIPVRPGAHYMIGGVTVGPDGQTTVPGLWAAGEVTSSGLHGANRLASNSLLEGLVFGARAGAGASVGAMDEVDSYRAIPLQNPPIEPHAEPLDLVDIRNSLQSLMWRSAGVKSDGAQLTDAQQKIRRWCGYVLSRQFADPAGWELQNMLIVASLMVDFDLEREESRGVHLRSDFPERDDANWRRHLTARREE
jgi:L-aspartate oxidase